MNFVRLCTLVLSVLVVGKVLFSSLIHTLGKLNLSLKLFSSAGLHEIFE